MIRGVGRDTPEQNIRVSTNAHSPRDPHSPILVADQRPGKPVGLTLEGDIFHNIPVRVEQQHPVHDTCLHGNGTIAYNQRREHRHPIVFHILDITSLGISYKIPSFVPIRETSETACDSNLLSDFLVCKKADECISPHLHAEIEEYRPGEERDPERSCSTYPYRLVLFTKSLPLAAYVIFRQKKRISTPRPLLPSSSFQVTISWGVQEGAMRQHWRAKLTPFQQRIFDRSTAVTTIELDLTSQLRAAVKALPAALVAEEQARVAALSQTIVNHICWRLNVRTVQVRVHGTRPSNRQGELHGLYTQYSGGSKNDSIQVWMRTAKRKQTVAFRTFLRTLLHEICHHLDYTYFHFRESYHTEGFFQRESSLFRLLVAPTAKPSQTPEKPPQSLSSMVQEVLLARTHAQPEQ